MSEEVAHVTSNHFEVYVDDPERARKFYTDVFGWTFSKWEGPSDYWLVRTGQDSQPGINGGLMQRPAPEAMGCNIIDVPSVDEYTNKVTSSGGSLLMPKIAIPGVGYVAFFKDTEGNPFGGIEEDSSAK